uniref:Secreted protein n=1 Tax=Ciona intestinalis TaxID=7719 RepID=H2XTY8_CIOIN
MGHENDEMLTVILLWWSACQQSCILRPNNKNTPFCRAREGTFCYRVYIKKSCVDLVQYFVSITFLNHLVSNP